MSISLQHPRISPAPAGSRWPSGDFESLAILPISEELIHSVLGLELIRGVEDGLGAWAAVGFRLQSGVVVELIQHGSAPGPKGFELRADKGSDMEAVLLSILSLFNLERNALAWCAPGLGA